MGSVYARIEVVSGEAADSVFPMHNHTNNHYQHKPMSASFSNIPRYARTSKRVTITIPFHVFTAVSERSSEEGRSLSNLIAYLLERALEQGKI
jgi:predicted DNA binding CopG/RHH family protein